jgi:hypothetical protein
MPVSPFLHDLGPNSRPAWMATLTPAPSLPVLAWNAGGAAGAAINAMALAIIIGLRASVVVRPPRAVMLQERACSSTAKKFISVRLGPWIISLLGRELINGCGATALVNVPRGRPGPV